MAQPRQWMGQPPPELRFLGELAVSESARVDLCRIAAGPHTGRLVAMKRLRTAMIQNDVVLNAFRDEIWMVTSLDHENIARVVCWGEDAEGPFLATEFVYGVSLLRLMRTVVQTGDGFGERFVVYVAGRVAHALASAHSLRSSQGEPLELVHRDLTPTNVLVGVRGEVKLSDFGLAKAKQRITQTIVGRRRTHHAYMAPEQSMALPVDGRADIFSLGVIMFELFANRHPWFAQAGGPDGEGDIVGRMLSQEPASLAELCPRIDPRLVEVVQRCVARDPVDRFPSAAQLAKELDDWLLAHGYKDSAAAMGRIVRRHALKQLRQFDRLLASEGRASAAGTGAAQLAPQPAFSQPAASPEVHSPAAQAGPVHGASVPASAAAPSGPAVPSAPHPQTPSGGIDSRAAGPPSGHTSSDARRTTSFQGPAPEAEEREDLATTRLAVRPKTPSAQVKKEPVGEVVSPDPTAPPLPFDTSGHADAPPSSRQGAYAHGHAELLQAADAIVAQAQRVAALAEHAARQAQHAAEQATFEAAAANSAAQAASQAARAAAWASRAIQAYEAGDAEQAQQLMGHAMASLEPKSTP